MTVLQTKKWNYWLDDFADTHKCRKMKMELYYKSNSSIDTKWNFKHISFSDNLETLFRKELTVIKSIDKSGLLLVFLLFTWNSLSNLTQSKVFRFLSSISPNLQKL